MSAFVAGPRHLGIQMAAESSAILDRLELALVIQRIAVAQLSARANSLALPRLWPRKHDAGVWGACRGVGVARELYVLI